MRTIIHACGGCGVNITATELELLKSELYKIPKIKHNKIIKCVEVNMEWVKLNNKILQQQESE